MPKSSLTKEANLLRVPTIPIRDVVIFPFAKVKFTVGRQGSVQAVEKAISSDKTAFVVTQRNPFIEKPTPEHIYRVGTLVNILTADKENEQYKVTVVGVRRAEIINIENKDSWIATVKPLEDVVERGRPTSRLMQRLGKLLEEYAPAMSQVSSDNLKAALHYSRPAQMVDQVAEFLPLISVEDKQELLEINSVHQRLERIISLLDSDDEKPHTTTQKTVSEHMVLPTSRPPCIFIGHGRNPLWARLQIFLEKKLGVKTVNYESEPRVGESIVPILEAMLEQATFAVLILTAEDETSSGAKRARQNVVHEAGLFQGKLGFRKAILLRQEGTEDFSNVAGLQYISFSDDKIEQAFWELQEVLKREGQLP
jgi:predicted nucleotide-binding protein